MNANLFKAVILQGCDQVGRRDKNKIEKMVIIGGDG